MGQIDFPRFICVAFFAALALSCSAATDPVRDLTQTHTRLVWCQDCGDGSDSIAEGNKLRLMGYDSDDGRAERVILGSYSNYVKPMLTADGKRIVFSNRQEQKVSLVNWDGSGLKKIGTGFAIALWRDPGSLQEWVYIGQVQSNATALINIRRHLLDRPEISETVWDRTPLDIDNFQLSADARHASGLFPWPDCGILDLPNGVVTKYGTGCWPALAPDQSLLLWIFDGAHRNLTLCAEGGRRRWQVVINTAPGNKGYEVYHPRWSNHSRYMELTGPYKISDLENRIRKGGTEVEIYLGRFTPDFSSIEKWVQVTHNQRGDFFPDAWLASGWTIRLDDRSATNVVLSTSMAPKPGPGAADAAVKEKRGARLILEVKLEAAARIPAPASILPYRRALAVGRYRVEKMIVGDYSEKEILAAHWVIRDGKLIPGAQRKDGATYRLTVESYAAHPELEGERLIMENDDFRLPLYYEVE